MDYKVSKLETVKKAMEAIKAFEENNFYPEEAGRAYFFSLKREDDLKARLESLKMDLKRQKEVKEYLDKVENQEHAKMISDLVNFHGYVPDYLETAINKEIDKLIEEKKEENVRNWSLLIDNISRSHFVSITISYYLGSKYVMQDEFNWLRDVEFNLENIIKNKDKIRLALKNVTTSNAVKDFVRRNEYGLLSKHPKLTTGVLYEVHNMGVYDHRWYDPTVYSPDYAKTVLESIYFLANANKGDFKENREVIKDALKELSELDSNNKRLSIRFMGCDLQFFKTKDTKMSFTQEMIDNIEKEIESQKKEK